MKDPFRVLSFNAWIDLPLHPPWHSRRMASAAVLNRLKPAIAGGQEYSITMLRDIEQLCPWLEWTGCGREDGADCGEFTPIFYNPSLFHLLDSGTFWLTPNPSSPLPGWNARCRRTVTWAKFRPINSTTPFFFANTHLDHFGTLARIESARLILQYLESVLVPSIPLILTGDFNCSHRSLPYRILTATGNTIRLADARSLSKTPPEGPLNTWTDRYLRVMRRRLDFILCSPSFKVTRYRVIDNPVTRQASDHRPVVVDLQLPSGY